MADSDLQEAVLDALKHYNDLAGLQASPLSKLDGLWPLPPSVAGGLLASQATGLAVRRLLDQGLERLRQTWVEAAELLHQNFRLLKNVKEIAEEQDLTSPAIYAQRRKAIVALTAIMATMAAEAAESRQERVYRQTQTLPFEGQVVGFEGYLARIREVLRVGLEKPSLLVVAGLGGIGKTSLICFALRNWLTKEASPIDKVLWVTVESRHNGMKSEHATEQNVESVLQQIARQLKFPIAELSNNQRRLQAIAGHLLRYRQRFVIVVDGVTRAEDADVVLALAKSLLPLAQVVVTSRHDIEHNQAKLLRVGELTQAHALELLRLEAKRRGMLPLSDEEAQQLYREVGGHPLVLKLMIEQVDRMPIAQALSALQRPSPLANQLYDQVYEPCWPSLSPLSRQALLRLQRVPICGQEASWQELHMITSICDESALEEVVLELTRCNLLQVNVSPTREYKYFFHRLTGHFLAYKSKLNVMKHH